MENINTFENWLIYMQNNTIFDLSELLDFKEHYQNGLSNAQNGNLFYEFAEDKKDLFEYYDELPQEVREILSFYELEEMDYLTCENLLKELNAVGYTFEYGLSAEPFNLKKILP